MKKLKLLTVLCAGLSVGSAAFAETMVGFTIYKYDDNFMSVVRQAIEKEASTDQEIKLLMNDSQNSQSMQNDQIDIMLARGVKALAINLVDPAAAPVIIQKAKMDDVPIIFLIKNPPLKCLRVMIKLITSVLTLKNPALFKESLSLNIGKLMLHGI